MFATSPVGSIWLEMSINWYTTSQGPKKKCIKITKRRIDPCPAHTARNTGSFTTMVLWTVNPLFPQLYVFWILERRSTRLYLESTHFQSDKDHCHCLKQEIIDTLISFQKIVEIFISKMYLFLVKILNMVNNHNTFFCTYFRYKNHNVF